MTVSTRPPAPCCIASTFLPFFPLCYCCGYFCDLCVAAAFLLCSLCCMRFSRLRLRSLCRRPLLSLFCFVACGFAATSATFVSPPPSCICSLCCMRCSRLRLRPLCRRPLLSLFCFVACGFAATSATFVSPPPSCICSLCCMRCSRLRLRPLCRRRLSACTLSFVCVFRGYLCDLCIAAFFSPSLALLYAVFAATSATSVSPPPSRPSLLCCMRFRRLLLRPLCRRRLPACTLSVVCVVRGYVCDLCVAAAFLHLLSLCMRCSRLRLRPLCRRRLPAFALSVVCVFRGYVCDRPLLSLFCFVACGFAATFATFVSPPPFCICSLCCMRCSRLRLRPLCRRRLPAFALSVVCVFCGYVCDRPLLSLFALLHAVSRLRLRPLCRRRLPAFALSVVRVVRGYVCDLCVAAAFRPLLSLLYAFFAATSATSVSPPPSLPFLLCCMRFRGYVCDLCVAAAFLHLLSLCMRCSRLRLRPLCRRRLSACTLSVVCVFLGYLCDLCIAAFFSPSLALLYAVFAATSATSVSPPPSRPSLLCCVRFRRLLLRSLCRRRVCFCFSVPGPLCCRLRFGFYVLRPLCRHPSCLSSPSCLRFLRLLCVAAAFSPFFALLFAFFAATSATFVSPSPSCICSLCRMRFCGYLLRPLRRRRLPAFALPVVCVFAATSATFVSPPPSSLLCCVRFCRLLLQPLCRRARSVACGFAATSANFVSPPSFSLLCPATAASIFASMFRDLFVAAVLPFFVLLFAFLRLLLRPLCRRLLAFPRSVVCVCAAIPWIFLSPPPCCPFSLRASWFFGCFQRRLCRCCLFSSLCCCVRFWRLVLPLLHRHFLPMLTLPLKSCPFFARRVPVHHRCLGSSSAWQCCVPLAVPSFACWSSAIDLPAWVARPGRWFPHFRILVVPGLQIPWSCGLERPL